MNSVSTAMNSVSARGLQKAANSSVVVMSFIKPIYRPGNGEGQR